MPALVDLEARDQFAAGHRVAAGENQILGTAPRGGDGLHDALLHPALLAAEPEKTDREHGERGARGDDRGEKVEKQIAALESDSSERFHTGRIRLTTRKVKMKLLARSDFGPEFLPDFR